MPPFETESLIRPTHPAPVKHQPANISPETPVSPKNGEQLPAKKGGKGSISAEIAGIAPPIFRHEADIAGELIAGQAVEPPAEQPADGADSLEGLLARAMRGAKRGRPAAFDDLTKGKLVALLALGLSLRQAASLIGVHHSTITNTLKADPALEEEIKAARFQAQVQPLACIVRESRRSWKAATWLLKYLDGKIASHEETPDERKKREKRERDEFFGRVPKDG